ncbi:hypothetical protein IC582_017073 [Cucumis melo]
MVFPIIQRQQTMKKLLQILLLEHLLLHYHLHHRPFEILKRICRFLHHRKTLPDFPLHRAWNQPLEHRKPRRRLDFRRWGCLNDRCPLLFTTSFLFLLLSPQFDFVWFLPYGFQSRIEFRGRIVIVVGSGDCFGR